jgi:hypothetical protein
VARAAAGHPGHEKPKTENRIEFIENRTEFTETEKIGSRFGSDFSGINITEVFSVLDLSKPKYRAVTEFI